MSITTITLTEHELRLGAQIGAERCLRSIMRKSVDTIKNDCDNNQWQANIIGALGEIAVAKYLNIYYLPTVDTYKSIADLQGGIEVRCRSRADYELIVRDNDPSERLYVLVTGVGNTFTLHGYMQGSEAKRSEWWQQHGGYKGAYFVPHKFLNPVSELKIYALGVKQ